MKTRNVNLFQISVKVTIKTDNVQNVTEGMI